MSTMILKEEIQIALQNLGLRKNEAKVYIALTELGQASTTILTKVSGIPRSKIYDILSRLESLNLVLSENSEGGVNIHRVIDLEQGIVKLEETLKENIKNSSEIAIKGLKKFHQTYESNIESLQEIWSLKGVEKIKSTLKVMIQGTKREILCTLDFDIFKILKQELRQIIKKDGEIKLLMSLKEEEAKEYQWNEFKPHIRFFSNQKLQEILDNYSSQWDDKKLKNIINMLELVFTERPNILIFNPKTKNQTSMLILKSSNPTIGLIAIHLENKEFIDFQTLTLERMWDFVE